MIFVVDGHDKDVFRSQPFFLKDTVNLILVLGESASGKVGVEDAVTTISVSDKPLFHHFDVDVNDVVIQPFSEIQAAQSLMR